MAGTHLPNECQTLVSEYNRIGGKHTVRFDDGEEEEAGHDATCLPRHSIHCKRPQLSYRDLIQHAINVPCSRTVKYLGFLSNFETEWP